tara:strand:- start:269 stop:859 length:591 start_codon:yes stop_codon:yes gene_type:complete
MSNELKTLLTADSIDLSALAAHLDGLEPTARVAAVRTITGAEQQKIWGATEGQGATLADLVPEGTDAAFEVINYGKNSLPVFTHFEKRMCRVEGEPDKLYGYNEGQTRPFVGPGYFVAHDFPERGEVGIDYRMVPPDDAKLPDGWPKIKPNEKGVQMFVYKGMVDYMRRVSQTVTIGRAYKGGEKDLGHTFLLCRH